MNRRDTIIIAVLINAGLLAVLFLLAINTEEENVPEHSEIVKNIVEAQAPAPLPSQNVPVPLVFADASPIDEVDNFLKDLGSAELSQPGFVDDEAFTDLETEAKNSQQTAKANNSKPSSSSPSDIRYVEVTVKRGDALEKIARNNATTVEAIKKTNNLNSSKLVIGQVLRIPISASSSPLASPAPSKKTEKTEQSSAVAYAAEPQYYTIKSGDNPWKIAKQYQVKFEDLLKLNGLDEEKARNLKVGDKVRVR